MTDNTVTAMPREARADTPRFSAKRLLPLVVLAAGVVAFFAFGLDQ